MNRKLLGMFLGLAWCGVALAEDTPQRWYVSTGGNDANDGKTPQTAWKSIARANQAALHPGDRLLFEGGQHFSGSLLIHASGAEGSPIVIGSHGSGAATIDAGDSFGVRLENCQYVTVEKLVLRGSGVDRKGHTSNTAQGLDIYSSSTTGRPWRSIYADHLTVSGFRDGIVAHTPVGTQEIVGFDDVRITHCTVSECLFGGVYCWGSGRTSGKPWLLPLGAKTFDHFYLGDCVIHDIYGDPVGDPLLCLPVQIFNATSSTVERCVIHDCGESANPKGSQGGIGGLVFLECDRCVGQFNECYKMISTIRYDGCAFDLDGGCSNCVLQYNYSHDNDGSGYQTGSFQGSGPVTDNTIRYNISENDVKKNPDSCGGIMTWSTVSRGQIYNNTVYVSATGGTKPAAFLGSGSGLALRNNIFVASHDGDIIKSGGGYRFENNSYFRTDKIFAISYGNRHFSSLAEWRQATGQEMVNKEPVGFWGDPRLRNPGGAAAINDPAASNNIDAYDLLPDSELIGKAMVLHGIVPGAPGPQDFRGRPIGDRVKLNVGAVDEPGAAK